MVWLNSIVVSDHVTSTASREHSGKTHRSRPRPMRGETMSLVRARLVAEVIAGHHFNLAAAADYIAPSILQLATARCGGHQE